MQQFFAQGHPLRALAWQLQVHRHTVRTYAQLEQIVEQGYGRRFSVDPYRGYLEQRWAKACTQVMQHWLELQACRFRGGYKSVSAFTRSWPLVSSSGSLPPQASQSLRTAWQAMCIFLLPPERLTDEETAYREALSQVCLVVAIVYPLLQTFV